MDRLRLHRTSHRLRSARRSEITIDIVAKLTGQLEFVVLHRRWVVERSLSWINQHRRCAHDYERLPEHHEAIVRWTMIHTISKRLT